MIEDDQKLSIVTKAKDDEVPSESFSSNFWHVRHWRDMFVKLVLVIVLFGHLISQMAVTCNQAFSNFTNTNSEMLTFNYRGKIFRLEYTTYKNCT